MVFYYKASGIIADVALILNVVLTLATLAIFRATLTLPGIAGLVLSIGMAVDANILVHERIKEELRWGKTVRAAVDQGYHRPHHDHRLEPDDSDRRVFLWWNRSVKGFAVTFLHWVLAIFPAVYITRLI
jgi:preprotein translocase subunit SecD